MPAYRLLLDKLSKDNASALVFEGARPYLLACLYKDLKHPMLVITAQPEKSRRLGEQVSSWLDAQSILQLPEPDGLPYTRITPDIATELEKLQVLSQLARPSLSSSPPLVIASVPALLQKLPSSQLFRSEWVNLKKGMEIDPLKLLASLNALGYQNESLVEVPGSISRRGGIIDIFPPTSEMPVRAEFFGNTIDSLRLFEPVSQRSLKPVDTIDVGPASVMSRHFTGDAKNVNNILNKIDLSGLNAESRQEFERDIELFKDGQSPASPSFYSVLFNTDTLLSYLPPSCLVVLDEPRRIEEEVRFLDNEAQSIFEQRQSSQELPRDFPKPYFTWEEIEPGLSRTQHLEFPNWQTGEESEALRLDFSQARSYAGQLPAWIEKVKQLIEQNKRVIAISHQAGRLA